MSGADVRPRVRMLVPVWGESYINRWLDLCWASMWAEGNVPYLNEACDFELAIITKSADITVLQKNARFLSLTAGLRTSFVSLDEFLPASGQTPYGVPLTLAYAKGILDLGADAIGTYVILMNADCILGAGSFRSLLARILSGYTVIAATSIRCRDGDLRTVLEKRVSRETGVLDIPPREMMELAFRHLHNTVACRTVNDLGPIDSTYYHQIFWRLSDHCLAMRGFLLHPLCFRVERMMEKVLCPVDYGFITEFCPEARYCVLNDSDDYLMLELQERDTESHWLRIAPRTASVEDKLARLSDEIVAHVATWSTSEQRRAAGTTIYYHDRDLPPDAAERVAPFERFVEGVLAKLPAPISHTSHFQWLPAVRFYRQDMARGGSSAAIQLLDDPRNGPPPPPIVDKPATLARPPGSSGVVSRGIVRRILGPLTRPLRRRLRSWVSRAELRTPRSELGSLIDRRVTPSVGPLQIAFVDIGNIRDEAPSPPAGASVVDLGDPSAGWQRHDFNIRVPGIGIARDGTLIIYAIAGFLSTWDRIEEDIASLLETRRSVVLALIMPRFRPIAFAEVSYILSVLVSCIPKTKFTTSLDVYLAPHQGIVVSDPPTHFSALVLTVTPTTPRSGEVGDLLARAIKE